MRASLVQPARHDRIGMNWIFDDSIAVAEIILLLQFAKLNIEPADEKAERGLDSKSVVESLLDEGGVRAEVVPHEPRNPAGHDNEAEIKIWRTGSRLHKGPAVACIFEPVIPFRATALAKGAREIDARRLPGRACENFPSSAARAITSRSEPQTTVSASMNTTTSSSKSLAICCLMVAAY